MCSKERILELHIPKLAGIHIVSLHVVCAHLKPRSTVRIRCVVGWLPFDLRARLSGVFWFEAKAFDDECDKREAANRRKHMTPKTRRLGSKSAQNRIEEPARFGGHPGC